MIAKNEQQKFQPNWVSSPGETIIDILTQKSISILEFTNSMRLSKNEIKDLLQGKTSITIRLARQLSEILGASVEFWMSRDYQYRNDTFARNPTDLNWLKQLPLGDMIKFKWLPLVPHPSDELKTCLAFFDVSSVEDWQKKYENVLKMVSFRTSSSFDSKPAAIAAWLRQGELQASSIRCGSWNPNAFSKSLQSIRQLTKIKDPNQFLPKLQKECSENGVAVVIVRSPSGCRASGATRFITNDKAILQLSFRYLTDDHFWFTFFHEAAHLILHGKSGLILEGFDNPITEKEAEANDFAAKILLPGEFNYQIKKIPLSPKDIVRFAIKVGISPGIIVGQLQYIGRLKQSSMNSLKRRYKWV